METGLGSKYDGLGRVQAPRRAVAFGGATAVVAASSLFQLPSRYSKMLAIVSTCLSHFRLVHISIPLSLHLCGHLSRHL